MSDVIIYGAPASSYVRTARMTCEEKGITHDLEPIDFGSESHLALHPFGKMPAMRHGDLRLYETESICRYIDDAFDGPELTPPEPHRRAIMNQWISSINCYMYGDLVKRYALQYIFPKGPDGAPDRAVIDEALPRVKNHLAMLDAAYGVTPYLAGPDLSLADLFVAPLYATAAFMPETKEMLADLPNLKRAGDELIARPSYRAVAPQR